MFGLQACLMLFSFGHLFQEPFTSKQTAPSPPFFLPSQREAMYFNKGHIILKWSVTIQREEEWVRVRVRGRCFTNWPGENILQSKLSSKYWGTYYITSLTPRSSPFFFLFAFSICSGSSTLICGKSFLMETGWTALPHICGHLFGQTTHCIRQPIWFYEYSNSGISDSDVCIVR